MMEMFQSGELKTMLDKKGVTVQSAEQENSASSLLPYCEEQGEAPAYQPSVGPD